MEKPKRGLIIGKFLPPHRGHQFLIEFGRQYVQHLTVLVCTLKREPIPGELRWRWLRSMFSDDVEILHNPDELPQEPCEHPYFWRLWHDSIRKFLPNPDVVFASETYGWNLAEVLGAEYVPVDLARDLVPISGTRVREDPIGHWDYLPEVVRSHYVKKVCIMGPESTGKTTLARRLADHFRTRYVQEYARPLIDVRQGLCLEPDIIRFVRGQRASEEALAVQANRVLICDTDVLTTQLWSEYLFGKCPLWVRREAARQAFDLTLVAAPDVPWVSDWQRYQASLADRRNFFTRCREELERLRRPYAILEGDWNQRWEIAVTAVSALLAGPFAEGGD